MPSFSSECIGIDISCFVSSWKQVHISEKSSSLSVTSARACWLVNMSRRSCHL